MTEQTEEREYKIDSKNRADYLKAEGYDVTLRVTYTRVRRVRALSKTQAREFAIAREEMFSERYFSSQNLKDYHVDSVRAPRAVKVEKEEEVVE